MDALLNQLLLVFALELVGHGLLTLLVDMALLDLVFLDALDVDFKGALDGVLEHEVSDRGATLKILGNHIC